MSSSFYTIERSAMLRLNDESYLAEYQITGTCYHDPGRVSGPPEDCYPPESSSEVSEVELLQLYRDDDMNYERVEDLVIQAAALAEIDKLPLDEYLLEEWMAAEADGEDDEE